jgi:plastocyanin
MLSMRTFAALFAAAAALALSACGGNDKTASSGAATATPAATDTPAATATEAASGGGGGGGNIALAADPGGALKFDKATLTAKAGKTTITFTNDSSLPHAVAVEGNGLDKDGKTVTKGTDKLVVDLKPGTYTYYCPVDGHRAAGMEGKLTVE